MSNIFIICISVLVFPVSIFAQNETKLCPAMQVIGPLSVTTPGEPIIFSAKVGNDTENPKLKYEWTISLGTIVEGQNTSTIRVATTPEMSGTNVTAKVVVEGLPDKCPNELSEDAPIANLPIIEPIDDYEKSSWNIEAGRLDNMFTVLLNNPHTVAFIIIFETENGQGKKRIKKIVKHSYFRQFPKQRLIFAIGKSNSQRTIIFINKENTKLPKCENCEIIKGEDVK